MSQNDKTTNHFPSDTMYILHAWNTYSRKGVDYFPFCYCFYGFVMETNLPCDIDWKINQRQQINRKIKTSGN